jgi:hypothetical protein
MGVAPAKVFSLKIRESTRNGIGIATPIGSAIVSNAHGYTDQDSVVGQYATTFTQQYNAVDSATIIGGHRILFKEIWSGDAELPHADDIILVHGKVRVRIGEHLYI